MRTPPGFTEELDPRPEHGEHSYRGCGKLEGRAALITGSDSGIRRAAAIAFAREVLAETSPVGRRMAWAALADLRVQPFTEGGTAKAE